MTWPPWAESHNACETHDMPDCPECEGEMWNPELVAKLEAERANGLPRRKTAAATADSAAEIAKRRKLAAQIARKPKAR